MQTWKTKKREVKKPKKTWAIRVLAIVILLATAGVAYFDFWSVNEPFKLGLDLQGGTHLVYEANMSEIPSEDRISALEGVKDVIERRVNSFGVAEPVVQTTTTGGTHRIIIELAGILDVKEAIAKIGETPVLEFKEPEPVIERDLTQEEKDELVQRQSGDYQTANEALGKARSTEDFTALVNEYSIEKDRVPDGLIEGITETTPGVESIVAEINRLGTRSGSIHSKIIENEAGLNIVKFNGKQSSNEMLLSHILICFEGKTGCANPIPEIDANLQINKIKEEVTPENFAQIAFERSTDQSGEGGDLGWLLAGKTVPSFELEAMNTKVGEISNVVETEFGYHIIYKRDERQVDTYNLQRILMKYSTELDIVPYSPWKNTELSGKYLKRAGVEFNQTSGTPIVTLNFNSEGGDLFGQLTESHVGQQIAIFLDGEPISTPVVQEAIFGGQAIIQGDFTLEEAKTLAQRLNAGALPVPVDLLSQQTVGPTLGSISLQKSIDAAIIGFALVALFMILVYRLPGIIAVIALIFYAVLNLGAYRFFGVTITLAGIAGFVLSLGIAVDANVLIIERFKEEYKSGRDYASSIDEGFKRAWNAIRDGNITTLIAAFVLFYFSSSFIKGFALTLSIGVILSMFTAIFVSRVFLKNVMDWKLIQKESIYGVKRRKEENE
ncbi:MAG: protein translocase subunit SecD [Patescibacteria group bacterium]